MNRELIVWIVVGVLILLGLWAYGERRFNQGAHSRDVEVSQLNTQLASAAVALNQCNDSAKANETAAKAQRAMADAALDAATKHDKGQTQALTDAVNRLKAAQETSDCKAVAEAELCPALSNY